jgi:hypothetical protein
LLKYTQGDKLSRNGAGKQVRAKIKPEQLRKPWKAQIVWSGEECDNLPKSIPNENAKDLCIVEASLERVQKVVKNDHWWSLGKRYHLAEFEVRVIPGSADLKFELSNMGRLVNTQNDTVQVDWDPPRGSVGSIDHLNRPF